MSRLTALKRRARRNEQGDDEVVSALEELGVAMIHANVPKEVLDRLNRAGPYSVILVAPTEQHVRALAFGIEALSGSTCQVVAVQVDPVPTRFETLLNGMRQGAPVIAVASDIDLVPAPFRALADEMIEVATHDLKVLKKALRTLLGTSVPPFPPDFTLHPDPNLLCNCILPHMSAARVIEALDRLGRMVHRPAETLPPLSECVEFGEAQKWSLGVMQDLNLWKRGGLAAADLNTSCLLVSPPGHGKTFLARVLAASLEVQLFEITAGSLFVGDGHLGDVLQEMRRQFAAASKAAPAVLLLDELDSFSRRDTVDSNKSFTSSVINELLTLLDGASQRRPGLVIIGATNMPDALDPAIRRPGRLSKTIRMTVPGADGIEHILRTHLRGDLADQSLDDIVRLAAGSTPAMLMDVTRRARQLARAAGCKLTKSELKQSLVAELSTDAELTRRVAVHEAGHALACLLLPGAPRLRSVSLIAETGSLGHVDIAPAGGATTVQNLEARIMTYLAGRAAEELVYDAEDPSDGACMDLKVATSLACRMHAQLGMGNSLVHYSEPQARLVVDAEFAAMIDQRLQQMLASVKALIAGHLDTLLLLAEKLLRETVLTADEVEQIVKVRTNRALAAAG